MEKQCAKCHINLECRADQIELCQCSTIKVSSASKAFLEKAYSDCLCVSCLMHINQLSEQANRKTFPDKPQQLVLNKHYYIENGQWVFTELYHYLKGSCCGNQCRHCVYGNAKK